MYKINKKQYFFRDLFRLQIKLGDKFQQEFSTQLEESQIDKLINDIKSDLKVVKNHNKVILEEMEGGEGLTMTIATDGDPDTNNYYFSDYINHE